ncbi:MAG: arylesterase [Rhizobiaceae bacterium]
MKIKPVLHYSLFIFALLLVLPVTQASANCADVRVVVFGDSLVAGYGLPPGKAFPEQLSQALQGKSSSIDVINAGVSGDTTSGGLSRLEWSVGDGADIVVLELGANDALRGIPVEITRKNLDAMISRLKSASIEIVLAGMLAPPNMGKKYGDAFNAIYPELAEKHEIKLYPFFLEGVATDPQFNQDDGIHPNPEGVQVMVKNFMPALDSVLEKVCARKL